jgi:hypothetical protein
MRWIAILAAWIAAGPAFAGQVWWQRATHYADGGELRVDDPVTYAIETSTNGGAFAELRRTTAASIQIDHPAGVETCYRVIALVPDVDTVLVPSDPSNVWCADLRPGAPPQPQRRKPATVTGVGGRL